MGTITRVKLKVFGRVQGVFYRQSARSRATALGLTGWVRNAEDGSVEIEAAGPADAVEDLVNWCWQGPPASTVTQVEVQARTAESSSVHEPGRFEIL